MYPNFTVKRIDIKYGTSYITLYYIYIIISTLFRIWIWISQISAKIISIFKVSLDQEKNMIFQWNMAVNLKKKLSI